MIFWHKRHVLTNMLGLLSTVIVHLARLYDKHGAQQILRHRLDDALIAAGLMRPRPTPDPALRPLSEQERAELADQLGALDRKPLSEIIIEEREGR